MSANIKRVRIPPGIKSDLLKRELRDLLENPSSNLLDHYTKKAIRRRRERLRRLERIKENQQRHARAVARSQRIFSDNDIRAIREALKNGGSYRGLAREFDCSPITIKRIHKRETYGDVK